MRYVDASFRVWIESIGTWRTPSSSKAIDDAIGHKWAGQMCSRILINIPRRAQKWSNQSEFKMDFHVAKLEIAIMPVPNASRWRCDQVFVPEECCAGERLHHTPVNVSPTIEMTIALDPCTSNAIKRVKIGQRDFIRSQRKWIYTSVWKESIPPVYALIVNVLHSPSLFVHFYCVE